MQPTPDLLLAVILDPFRKPMLPAVLFGLVLYLLLSVATAVKNGAFEWARLADWLSKLFIPYAVGYLVVAWVMAGADVFKPWLPDTWYAMALTAHTAVLVTIGGALVGMIGLKLKELTGVDIPSLPPQLNRRPDPVVVEPEHPLPPLPPPLPPPPPPIGRHF